MIRIIRIFLVTSIVIAVLSPNTIRSAGARSATTLVAGPPPAQYDDPYSEFRNVRYSNAGLLNEREELKLGVQLHREATKKFNLTDAGLARVDRIGQRCAR